MDFVNPKEIRSAVCARQARDRAWAHHHNRFHFESGLSQNAIAKEGRNKGNISHASLRDDDIVAGIHKVFDAHTVYCRAARASSACFLPPQLTG
jgi:hypothetical protein